MTNGQAKKIYNYMRLISYPISYPDGLASSIARNEFTKFTVKSLLYACFIRRLGNISWSRIVVDAPWSWTGLRIQASK